MNVAILSLLSWLGDRPLTAESELLHSVLVVSTGLFMACLMVYYVSVLLSGLAGYRRSGHFDFLLPLCLIGFGFLWVLKLMGVF